MSTSRIEFHIKKDASGKHVDLNNMSVNASKVLIKILESLNNIAQTADNEPDYNIKITKGSACISLEAPSKNFSSIANVIVPSSTNKKSIPKSSRIVATELNKIRSLISANGVEYDAILYNDGKKIDVIDRFLSGDKFKYKREPTKKRLFERQFVEGKLIEIGGKKPNIHVQGLHETYTISCTEDQAILINKFLYKPVYLSVWTENVYGSKPTHQICDYYVDKALYDEYKEFTINLKKGSGTEPLHAIHNKLRSYYDKQEFGQAKKFIRLFIHDSINENYLQSILVISKAFKANNVLKDSLNKIVEILEKKLAIKLP